MQGSTINEIAYAAHLSEVEGGRRYIIPSHPSLESLLFLLAFNAQHREYHLSPFPEDLVLRDLTEGTAETPIYDCHIFIPHATEVRTANLGLSH